MHIHSLLTIKHDTLESSLLQSFRNLLGIEKKDTPEDIDAFSKNVSQEVFYVMAPYSCNETEFTTFEFFDMTDDIRSQYDSEVEDFIRYPDGRFEHIIGNWSRNKFIIHNNQVYETNVGPLGLDKRTHKAKKMKAFLSYPMKKVYSFHDYAIKWHGLTYDSETGRYGYYANPNAMWDRYSIGGRWPTTFLVKDTCQVYATGEKRWGDKDNYPTPEGYQWVSAARKKDIEWEEMKNWEIAQATKAFHHYEEMFTSGILDDDKNYELTEHEILRWGDLVYSNEDTIETFLERSNIHRDRKYNVTFCDLISEGNWISDNLSHDSSPEEKRSWNAQVDKFIDEQDNDDILVSIDYHI